MLVSEIFVPSNKMFKFILMFPNNIYLLWVFLTLKLLFNNL